MIKEKDLNEWKDARKCAEGEGISYTTVREYLEYAAGENGIALAFRMDEIKYSGWGGGTDKCMVLYHPEHEDDYLNYCVRIKHEGKYAFVSYFTFGMSEQLANAAHKEYTKDTLKNAPMANKVGALIGAGVWKLRHGGVNNQKLEEEKQWYTILSDVVDDMWEN